MSGKNNGPAGFWSVDVPRMSDAPEGSRTTDTTNQSNASPAADASQQQTHQEGIQHLKDNTAQPSHLESSAAAGSTTSSSAQGQQPTTNPASDDSASKGTAGGVAALGAVGAGAATATAAGVSHAHYQKDVDSQPSHRETSEAAVPSSGTGHPSTSELIGHPPASNPSADDATGGLSKGQGGVSGSAYAESPVGDGDMNDGSNNNETTILGQVKSYLGLGQSGDAVGGEAHAAGSSDVADTTAAVDYSTASDKNNTAAAAAAATAADNNNDGQKAPGSALGYVAAASAALTSTAAAVQERVTGTKATETDQHASASGATSEPGSGSAGTYLDYSSSRSPDSRQEAGPQTTPQQEASSTTNDTTTATLADRTVEKVKDATTTDNSSSPSSSSSAAANTNDKTNNSSSTPHQSENKSQHDDSGSHSKKMSDTNPSKRENTDAIPTAGGQRLGEKHWGESKVVPDVPPKEDQGAGVSSAEGQPNDETRANTAKNTSSGGHDSSADGGEGKEGVMDKIKDKLNIGKKE